MISRIAYPDLRGEQHARRTGEDRRPDISADHQQIDGSAEPTR